VLRGRSKVRKALSHTYEMKRSSNEVDVKVHYWMVKAYLISDD